MQDEREKDAVGSAKQEAEQRERLREAQQRGEETLERAEQLDDQRERLERERPPDPDGGS